MNKSSISACRKVGFGEMKQPGDFCFDESKTHLYIWLPGAVGPDALRIDRRKTDQRRVWTWDGNEDKPTITPSISAPEWHGYFTNGKLQSC